MNASLQFSVRSVFRVDYKPTLDFYEKLFSTAAELSDDYPHWETNRLQVSLRDFQTRSSLTITHGSFIFSQDIQNSATAECQRIQKAIELIPARFGKTQAIRLGLRRKYLVPVRMDYRDLVDVFRRKFFTDESAFHQGICPGFEDLQLVFTSQPPGIVLTAIAPTFRDQLGAILETDVKEHFDPTDKRIRNGTLFEEYPERSIYIDCDYAEKEIASEELMASYNRGREAHERLVENVYHFLLGVD